MLPLATTCSNTPITVCRDNKVRQMQNKTSLHASLNPPIHSQKTPHPGLEPGYSACRARVVTTWVTASWFNESWGSPGHLTRGDINLGMRCVTRDLPRGELTARQKLVGWSQSRPASTSAASLARAPSPSSTLPRRCPTCGCSSQAATALQTRRGQGGSLSPSPVPWHAVGDDDRSSPAA